MINKEENTLTIELYISWKNNRYLLKDFIKETLKEIEDNKKTIEEIKEYCEEIENRSIDYTDTDYDLGQDNVARDILRKIRGEDNGSN